MENKIPAWLKTAVFYQIYPQSFYDSNGDGIGDLPGIRSKLHYLQSLGVNALWLNPIFVSPFGDAGYDVADFYEVAPRYGTNEDAEQLFRDAHALGLRVVLDLVAGHTSIEHPWFRDSAKREPGVFRDRYIWTNTPWEALKRAGFVIGNCERAAAYHANFFYFQPSLNYGFARVEEAWQQPMDAPGPRATKAELQAIMEFWLRMGCDGFRVDMADSLVKNDPDRTGIRSFWAEIRSWLDAEWPEAVLISEWGNPAESIGAGFHVDFMLHFGEPAYQQLMSPCVEPAPRGNRFANPCYFQAQGGLGIGAFLENYLPHLERTRGRGFIALPTGNHDFSRPTYGRSPQELRVIYAMLLTQPGVPFIYYGDEIGIRYRDDLPSKEGGYGRTGTRTPMQWQPETQNLGFSSAEPERLYLPVDSAPDAPTVAEQEANPASLLNHTRRLLALRRDFPALGCEGEFAVLGTSEDGRLFVYLRSDASAKFAVAINPDAAPRSAVIQELRGASVVLAEGAELAGNGLLTLGGTSWGIFRLAN